MRKYFSGEYFLRVIWVVTNWKRARKISSPSGSSGKRKKIRKYVFRAKQSFVFLTIPLINPFISRRRSVKKNGPKSIVS